MSFFGSAVSDIFAGQRVNVSHLLIGFLWTELTAALSGPDLKFQWVLSHSRDSALFAMQLLTKQTFKKM